jgi:dienelactone hydrolase
VLIVIYDIFGFHYNNFELADLVAKAKGWRVVIPDLFRGSAWLACNFPPKGKEEASNFSNFLHVQANPRQRLLDVESLLRSFGSPDRDFYLLGFCWGAKVASLVNSFPGVKAIAGAHPSFLEATDALEVAVPCLWLPTRDDDLSDYIAGLNSGSKGQKELVTIDESFRDMFHGFLAARGDWTEEVQRRRASDAIRTILHFFESH